MPGSARAAGAALLGAVGLLCFAGCAPKQRIPLYIEPGAEVYVDGDLLEVVPASVELRADRDHKVFVKRPGFRPELVVLESSETAGRPELRPAEVRVQLWERAEGDTQVLIQESEEGEESHGPGALQRR